jgi:uncharacterized membrane protein (DUF4010 family)
MLKELLLIVPTDALHIALVLALSFFIGLEREEHKQREAPYAFGGVRTFPLIGLVSYALALLSGEGLTPWALGFAIVGGFMALSYYHKLVADPPAGLTTEMSALATYALGGLVQREHYWIAATLGVLSVLLLDLKKGLEGLAKRFASNEIVTVAKFLLVSVVILPIVPDEHLTRFQIDPFETWIVVVAVSGVSFASYVVQRAVKNRGGVILSAVLGGAYSSTVTTVVLARQSKGQRRPNLFAGCILTASGMMYARLVLLLALFNRGLAAELAPAFGALAVIGGLAGWGLSRRPDASQSSPEGGREAKNPLELRAAFVFAFAFVVILVLAALAREHLGRVGLYSLAGLMGVTDVDPFILGLAQGGPTATPLRLAAAAIVIAAASNNAIKAIYAYGFADRATGLRSVAALGALSILGIIPLAWVASASQ